MYFNDNNSTDIDDQFKDNNKFLIFKNFLNKYKVLLIILIIVVIVVIVIFFLSFNNKLAIGGVNNYLDLLGEDVVTLYKNTDYLESGYKAYNDKNEDLSYNVIIDSNLNTKEIGSYEITYTLGNITKIRKVNVIAESKEYVYIKLNAINNDINIYLKVGEEYKEPGYKVYSSLDEDLTNKVQVMGSVDTSKKGNYKITYSVIDMNGVTISKSRMVYVMDTEINLSLNNSEWTNQDVIINVMVKDELFDYMILPDGSKIQSTSYNYKVIKNGKYVFKVYNKKGIFKEKYINVSNVDKEVPIGSCVVDHNADGSYITINVKDTSGVKSYIYKDKNYTNNKIVLNDYIEKASVVVYDKANNSSKFTCKVLEIKDEFLVDKSHYSDLSGLNYVKIIKVDLNGVGCNITTGSGQVREFFRVHERIGDDLYGILKNTCKYINKSSWINELQSAGAYVDKEGSYHAKGLAIDFNNQWTYTKDGVTYRPYASMGYSTWKNYNKFVCDVCDGKEDCKYNVNYVMFKRYFEGNGWCWGGNWGTEHFDPMHFEIRENNKCTIGRKQQISCE